MRIMLDTNILLSALAFNSEMLGEIVDKVGECHTMLLCEHILEEFRGVVAVKMPHRSEELEETLSNLKHEKVEKAEWKEYMGDLRDEDDKPILAAAILADADMIITGDKDFLESGITHPRIISHLDFLRDYME
ncbi:MAG: putative toxin-antitoxin system toxin component, PIN family [Turicibacter sp.]|nr:putative toxin-antitoxin system toxin component, PIN family [Turicibacter sp.]